MRDLAQGHTCTRDSLQYVTFVADSSRGEAEELKNITQTLLREFLSFSVSVKADLTAVKEDLTAVKADLTAVKLNLLSLWSKLDQVSSAVITNKRNIKAQDVVLDGFQSQLDSIQQAVETDMLDQGERLFNQTSALVSQLAGQQVDIMRQVVIGQGEKLSALVYQFASQQLENVQVVESEISDQGKWLFNQTSALVSQLAGQQVDSMQVVIDQGEQLFNQTSALVHQLADQQLDRIQIVERGMSDQGERLFNQTSALVSQLADRQEPLYHNLSNEVSSVCSIVRDDPPTQDYTTEPPAPPTSTTGAPTGSPTSTTGSLTSTASATESVTSATESPTEEGYSCGGTSGWRRVAFLNMTDPTHQCPSGWQLTGYSKRTCGRNSTSGGTCDSATFPTGGQDYSRVCGQVVAYQFDIVSAFYCSTMNIESMYVNGLSITHGSP